MSVKLFCEGEIGFAAYRLYQRSLDRRSIARTGLCLASPDTRCDEVARGGGAEGRGRFGAFAGEPSSLICTRGGETRTERTLIHLRSQAVLPSSSSSPPVSKESSGFPPLIRNQPPLLPFLLISSRFNVPLPAVPSLRCLFCTRTRRSRRSRQYPLFPSM